MVAATFYGRVGGSKEYPIAFKPELWAAILNTRTDRTPIDSTQPIKWVTRRLVNLRSPDTPKYKTGDRLYLSEATQVIALSPDTEIPTALVQYDDGVQLTKPVNQYDVARLHGRQDWKSRCNQRFMLRSFARYWVEVTAVRREPLQAITEEQAIGEGVSRFAGQYTFNGGVHLRRTAIEAFAGLWDSIHGHSSWDANPMVWVYEFMQVDAK